MNPYIPIASGVFKKDHLAQDQVAQIRLNQFTTLLEGAEKVEANIAKIMKHALFLAQSFIATTELLPGPTGETNEFYYVPRGKVLLIHQAFEPMSHKISIYLLSLSLAAGNETFFVSDDSALKKQVYELFGAHEGVNKRLHFIEMNGTDNLFQDMQLLAFLGGKPQEDILYKKLIKANNNIVGMISQTEFDQPWLLYDEKLIFQFVHERVRSINVTAIGGNADLIERCS